MVNEKPNSRIEKYSSSSEQSEVLASAILRKNKETLQDKTFRGCAPHCTCNTECRCDEKCDHCFCVDACSSYCPDHEVPCSGYCAGACVCVTSPY